MRHYSGTRKNNFLYIFQKHGSKDIYDLGLSPLQPEHFKVEIKQQLIDRLYGGMFMFDQEPVELLGFSLSENHPKIKAKSQNYTKDFSQLELILNRLATVYTPIICHSERNSQDIRFLEKRGFITAHYWWHGLISRDWFRHWKHYVPAPSTSNRLGCYIRDITGTRAYRKNLLEFIKQEKNIYCPILDGKVYDSTASAMIEWEDTGKFDIHIAAETLFDTSKTHLTEKVLKPIAMEQPFILFAGPNSLEYMRDYGFQTFSCCWDESYDSIQNSAERFRMLTELLLWINNLSDSKYQRMINKAKLIAKNNREYFYSNRFEEILLSEVDRNITTAFALQQENFKTNPGGMFFQVAEKYKKYDEDGPNLIKAQAAAIHKYLQNTDPSIAKQIAQLYPDLV